MIFRIPITTAKIATAALLALSATSLSSCASWQHNQSKMQHTEQKDAPTEADCTTMKQDMMAKMKSGDKGTMSPEMMATHKACMETMPDMMMKDCPKMSSDTCPMMKSNSGSMMMKPAE